MTCFAEIKDRVARNERALVTTLTKKMAEDLTDYLLERGIKVEYLAFRCGHLCVVSNCCVNCV